MLVGLGRALHEYFKRFLREQVWWCGLGLSIGREQVAFRVQKHIFSAGLGVDEVAQGDSHRVLFVSQRNALKELSQLMGLGLMPSDTAVSQRNVFDPLVEWTTKGAVLPVKNERHFDS